MTTRQRHPDPRVMVAIGRKYRGQTQQDLAVALTSETGERWTRAMVQKLESGEKTFDIEYLGPIAKIQGLPYGFYLEGLNSAKGDYLSSITRSHASSLLAAA